ncbi:MAG: integrase arm-type DNA-binding domain-containing protein [Bacteroidetes bacterium]|jgi:integrase|nr:integrase arm-type DNA-binding domain-containing protein [Bacteroidota bacterium]
MKLTDKKCKTATREKDGTKLSDGKGLYLALHQNGSKYWRYKYRIDGKEKLLSLGVYPEISLAEARERHRQAHKMVSDGIDPQQEKKQQTRERRINAANTFEAVAREWHGRHSQKISEKYSNTILLRMESDIFPVIGNRPIRDLTAPEILECLRKIEDRKAHELAHRAKQYIGQVMRYGIATGRCERDFTGDLKDALIHKKQQHFAALEPTELPEFIHTLRKNDARLYPQTRMAMEFLMLTFVRTNELIQARWEEIDYETSSWYIPAERMKMRQPHIVPLARQTLQLLNDLQNLGINSEWVFPSQVRPRNHMSNNTILEALRRMGYRGRMTGHGFRALAMTTIKERLNYRHEVIDRQLAHAHRNSVDAAYDRSKFLDERRKMMQDWANYIDRIANEPKVIQGNFGKSA